MQRRTWQVMAPKCPIASVGMLPVGGPLKFQIVFLSPPAGQRAAGGQGGGGGGVGGGARGGRHMTMRA